MNRVPYNAMDSRRIQQDVGAVKQEQLRKIEVGNGDLNYIIDGRKESEILTNYTS
ncbi:hypothetical protein [Shouchella lehensis]|uniref:hypothetical protein n=1 Tax=Shouchella lehensis TaxID=300825 RepID=UPI00130DEC33|nr:hypothetical protein [Shouchella lehensis]